MHTERGMPVFMDNIAAIGDPDRRRLKLQKMEKKRKKYNRCGGMPTLWLAETASNSLRTDVATKLISQELKHITNL